MKKFLLVFVLAFPFWIGMSDAQQLVYRPINPAFGGETFNYQWMLSSAQAQDTFTDPSADAFGYGRDPMEDFAESLNRQILSNLAREIVTRQFGEEGLQEGSYQLGDYLIDIGGGGGGLNVSIRDSRTGATTTVEVPHF
ncbi:curli assembly protein CsgF [Litoribacter ruber]|uniref:Curli production assembly/transport component CsgF n=1 Tax=Litoribacter ruber TaxID=702568 RepID=A0AAP2CIM3_9BACT|nr:MULTISPECIES: curli production assembly/transport component CsgF [Litoribacter]MBS9524354.1 curli assembly protein CsgF [Litoribacter alkaliphilus]MBT0809846.1 curli assembly protein CsgF [Litoribacter ruber]